MDQNPILTGQVIAHLIATDNEFTHQLREQKEQQRLNNNEEDDEDEEDEEEEEVKSDNSSVVVQQQPAPSMVESDPIKVKFERTFSKAIGSENKQKEQEQYRREIENLISEATFYYLTD